MQLKSVAGEKPVQDAEDKDQNGGFREKGGDAMRRDSDELFKQWSAI